uniref:J domain-containing protein n=1 Tax=Romanomermis culicivorax TaxID=13658 RepID=A0A915HRT3_ROMCU
MRTLVVARSRITLLYPLFSIKFENHVNFSSSTTVEQSQDFYAILNIPITANSKQIKAAYYQLSKLYHPDLYLHQNKVNDDRETSPPLTAKQAADKFRMITEAYETLGNETTRKKYDYKLYRTKYPINVDLMRENKGPNVWKPDQTMESSPNLDDIDDDVLKQLLKYERLRKYSRRRQNDYYQTKNVNFESSNENLKDQELYRQYEAGRLKHEQQMKKDYRRNPWSPNIDNNEFACDEALRKERYCHTVEVTEKRPNI